jgi:hypothetical protein
MFMAGLGVVPIRDSGSRSACRLAKSVPVGAVAAATRLPAAQAAAGPQRPRAQNGLDALLEPLVVEAGDLGEAERGAIAVSAVLERPDQLVAALYDAAAGSGRRQVDEDRVAPVRCPGAQEVGRRP